MILLIILCSVCVFLHRALLPGANYAELCAFVSILLSLPIGALIAGKVLDRVGIDDRRANIFSKAALPLTCVVAFNSPLFFETLEKLLLLSSAGNNIAIVLQALTLAGVYGATVSSILVAVILTFELPFRWFAESKISFISSLRPCALLLLVSLSFHLIVGWSEFLLHKYLVS